MRRFTSLLTSLLLAATWAAAQPPGDSLRTEELDELIDTPEETGQALWELRDLFGERAARPGFELRTRMENPDREPLPEQYMRARYATPGWEISGLVQRDTGEPNGADLTRISGEMSRGGLRVVAGDFRLDFGLGWTLATTPSWSTPTSPGAPFRRPSGGIRPMLSSEEGRGWRGAGTRLLTSAGELATRVHLWAGRARYDARQAGDGVLPYATQGDHTEERLETLSTVGETALGAALEGSLGPLRLGLIRSLHLFDKPLSDEDPASRFRFSDQRFSVNGLTARYETMSGTRAAAEVTLQEGHGWGGGVSYGKPLGETGSFSLSGWRATLGFAPLHARPFLPTGTDPAGRSGVHTAFRLRPAPGVIVSAGWFAELREGIVPTRSQGLFSGVQLRNGEGMTFEGRLSSRWGWEGGTLDKRSDELRLAVGRPFGATDLRLRGQLGRSQKGDGWGLTLATRSRLAGLLALDLSGTYLATAGSGVQISVVEPNAPGLFPVRRLSGRRLRLASRLRARIERSVDLWLLGTVEHRLAGETDPASRSWMAGMELRRPR